MNRNIKRFLAVLLACSVATSGITAQATDNANEIRTIIRSNDDENFPLNLQIDIDETTVEYIKLDDPIYEFDEILDGEKLEFDIIASLKDNYNNFSNYDVKLLTLDYDEVVYSNSSNNSDSLVISGLSAHESYKFEINLANETASKEYVGEFTVIIELDSSLVIDLFYQNSKDLGNIMSRIAPQNELESNNLERTHDDLTNGVSMCGDFTYSSNDVDYYAFNIGNVNNSTLNISLSVPDNISIKMTVYSDDYSYNETYISSIGTGRHIRITGCIPNTDYNIKLEKSSGTSTDKYYLTVNHMEELAWYGQFVSTIGTTDYWNPNKLDTLNVTHGSTTKPAFVQGNGATAQDWMEEGCGIAAAAMILRNMGETINGYDFRTNYSGAMMADPYTVMLANAGSRGGYMNESSTSLTVNNSPVYITDSNLISGFNIDILRIKRGNSGLITENDLKKLLDQYDYVMAYFTPGHWIVITDYNTSGTDFASRITVYDPASLSYSAGAGVLLKDTAGSYKTKGFEDISSVLAFYTD